MIIFFFMTLRLSLKVLQNLEMVKLPVFTLFFAVYCQLKWKSYQTRATACVYVTVCESLYNSRQIIGQYICCQSIGQ